MYIPKPPNGPLPNPQNGCMNIVYPPIPFNSQVFRYIKFPLIPEQWKWDSPYQSMFPQIQDYQNYILDLKQVKSHFVPQKKEEKLRPEIKDEKMHCQNENDQVKDKSNISKKNLPKEQNTKSVNNDTENRLNLIFGEFRQKWDCRIEELLADKDERISKLLLMLKRKQEEYQKKFEALQQRIEFLSQLHKERKNTQQKEVCKELQKDQKCQNSCKIQKNARLQNEEIEINQQKTKQELAKNLIQLCSICSNFFPLKKNEEKYSLEEILELSVYSLEEIQKLIKQKAQSQAEVNRLSGVISQMKAEESTKKNHQKKKRTAKKEESPEKFDHFKLYAEVYRQAKQAHKLFGQFRNQVLQDSRMSDSREEKIQKLRSPCVHFNIFENGEVDASSNSHESEIDLQIFTGSQKKQLDTKAVA